MNLKRLADILGMLGSSHPGEVLNAAEAANKMLTASGLTWHEILENSGRPSFASSDLDLAVRAAQDLLQENTELRTRIEELGDQLAKVASTEIPTILAENRNLKINLEGAKVNNFEKKPNVATAAEDEIRKAKRYRSYLNSFESDLLDSVIARGGKLTEKMVPIWARILRRVAFLP